ncbi:MAG TPA: BamA/TamA family outer membrane protein [Bryobacteraceae bacterium]|nr:BamA/TamA family outer membrane protein [Bryobacteraceae bacterium]
MKHISWVLVLATAACMKAETSSRIAEILAERAAKTQQLQPEAPSKMERRMDWLRDSEFLTNFGEIGGGVRVKVGGLVTGSGFAVGPEYSREGLFAGKMDFRTSAQVSMGGYQKQDLEVSFPRFVHDRLRLDFYGVHHNYPGLNYYGSGAGSDRNGRSNYRLEDTAFDAALSVRVAPKLTAGATTGYLFNNIGAGTNRRFISTEKIYNTEGVQDQANFSRVSVFAQFDTRDYAPGPRSGGNYFVQYGSYGDRTLGRSSFERLDLEAQQYVPFFNKRRVIAMRAKTAMTFSDRNQSLPFYMQPTLGGQDDLRGFRPFRFRDNNLLLMNTEYRWEVFSGLDMAVFGDAGKVFSRKSQLNLKNLETSAGFGFRFNARNNVFLRMDVGFSHEGFQVAMKFNNLFRNGPSKTSSMMGDF